MPFDISIGAIGAASIGALFTLIGLVISKETKTSEFRETWIGELRQEIAKFLSSINKIVDAAQVSFENDEGKAAYLVPFYADLNEASFQVGLRLNVEEEDSVRLLRAMRECQKVIGTLPIDYDALRKGESLTIAAGRKLLKKEWRRVKRGEITFRIAKLAAFLSLLALLGALLFISLTEKPLAKHVVAPNSFSEQTTSELVNEVPPDAAPTLMTNLIEN